MLGSFLSSFNPYGIIYSMDRLNLPLLVQLVNGAFLYMQGKWSTYIAYVTKLISK